MKGAWHSARTTTTEWPEEKGIPGVHLECTDGIVEWTAMNLFGDTVQVIPTISNTKKMKHSMHEGQEQEAGATTGVHTEIFPEGSNSRN